MKYHPLCGWIFIEIDLFMGGILQNRINRQYYRDIFA